MFRAGARTRRTSIYTDPTSTGPARLLGSSTRHALLICTPTCLLPKTAKQLTSLSGGLLKLCEDGVLDMQVEVMKTLTVRVPRVRQSPGMRHCCSSALELEGRIH